MTQGRVSNSVRDWGRDQGVLSMSPLCFISLKERFEANIAKCYNIITFGR